MRPGRRGVEAAPRAVAGDGSAQRFVEGVAQPLAVRGRPFIVDGRQQLTGVFGDRIRQPSLAHGLLERDHVDVRRRIGVPRDTVGVRVDELPAVGKCLQQVREIAPQRAARRLFLIVGKERERDRYRGLERAAGSGSGRLRR